MKKISKSPLGWEQWIEEQKSKGMTADEAFGIAWKQHNKGTKPPSKKKSINETIQDKSEDYGNAKGLNYEGSTGNFQEFRENEGNKKVLEPSKEINKWYKEEKGIKRILAIKRDLLELISDETPILKKTSKRFIWKFDKHQPQWRFCRNTGKMILDEEQLEKVGTKKKAISEESKRKYQELSKELNDLNQKYANGDESVIDEINRLKKEIMYSKS